ncbi:ATP-binding cassette domain-containing protein [bacterium]|nr:MAG: ATP-binding cassette domain-containing protein [bacterium]
MASPVVEGKLSPVQRFIRLLSLDKKEIGQLYFYAIFQGFVALSLPLGIQAIINLIQGGMLPTSWIVLVFIVVFGIIVSGGLQIMQMYIAENLKQRIFTRAGFEFAYRLPKVRFDALDRHYVPELVNRFFDTISIQKGISKVLLDFSAAVLQIIFGVILLSFYHPIFILFGLVLMGIVFLIIKYWGPKGLQTSLQESTYKYDVAFWLEEIARTLRVFKVAGETDLHLRKTDRLVEGYLSARVNHFKILVRQFASLVSFKAIVAAGLLILGSILVVDQQINLGQFVAAEIIILLVINSVEKIILSLEEIYDVLTAIEKVGSVTDWPLEKADGKVAINESNRNAFSLELNNLVFTYPDSFRPIVGPLDVTIEAGSKWVISGANGSGKSTLLHVLAGFFQNYEGTLLVNDTSLKVWDIAAYRSQIGTCFTDEELFQGSLRDNITMGRKNISDERIKQFAEKLFWDTSLKKLPDGLETILDPNANRLPKSLARKIILTRALIHEPKLVLIEDNLQHLSTDERKKIWEFLTCEDSPFTLIAISNNKDEKKCFSNQLNLG